MPGIQWIFFDAVGTLFKVHGSVGKIYSEFAQRRGFRTDPATLDRNFRTAFASMSNPELRGTERQWWLEVVRKTLADAIPPAELEPYFDQVFDFFRTSDAWRIYPDVLESLGELHRRGYRLGIISNFDSRLRDLIISLGIGRFFEHVTLSWEVGAAKPDPQIFSCATKEIGILPAEAIHVGDSIREDVEGSKAAGMIPVLLDRRGTHSGAQEYISIHSLTGLLRLNL